LAGWLAGWLVGWRLAGSPSPLAFAFSYFHRVSGRPLVCDPTLSFLLRFCENTRYLLSSSRFASQSISLSNLVLETRDRVLEIRVAYVALLTMILNPSDRYKCNLEFGIETNITLLQILQIKLLEFIEAEVQMTFINSHENAKRTSSRKYL